MRFKRLAALGLAAVMAGCLAVPVSAEGVEDKQLVVEAALAEDVEEFELAGWNNTLMKYNGNSENVTIPDNVGEIAEGAFAGKTKIKSVTIPASVTKIPYGVFSECTALTTIKVSSANPTYEAEKGVLYEYGYQNRRYLHTYPAAKTGKSFTVPSGVYAVGTKAFVNNKNLQTVKLSKTVEQIEEKAFSDCKSLKTFTLNKDISTIGADAFLGSSKLQSITGIANKNLNKERYVTIDGVLYSRYDGEMICYPEGKTGKSFTVPEGMSLTGASIRNNKYLQKIIIPANAEVDIGFGVAMKPLFSGCTSLASVSVKATQYGGYLFSKDGVLFSEDRLVYYPAAKKGETYTIPKDKKVDSLAFAETSKLKTVTLSEGTSVNKDFIGRIGSSISAIKVSSKNKDYSAKDGILYNKDKTKLICVPPQCKKTSLKVPSTVNEVDYNAFYNCATLESVEISRGVKSVMFNNCPKLKTVTLPVTIKRIESRGRGKGDSETALFLDCNSLSKIVYKGLRENLHIGSYGWNIWDENIKVVCADD